MKPDRLPESYFDTLSDESQPIKPFDPEGRRLALRYGVKLDVLLSPFSVRAELFGSTALKIAGKGEWEFGIWLDDERWYPVLVMLVNHFGSIYTLRDDFALFTDEDHDTEIEIIPMRREAAARNQAIMAYWRANPSAVLEYEQGKIAHAFSKREYRRWKNKHISAIVETL